MAIRSKRTKSDRKIKLALTCAPGGHFEQMQNLANFYKDYPHFWITRRTVQTEKSLIGENGHFINLGHFKRPWTYVAQFPRVYRILKKERPTHMLSTGSGMIVFVPFLLSWLFGIKFIHIETFSHVKNLTKMGKLLLRLHQPILSQWDMIRHKNVYDIGPIIASDLSISSKTTDQEIVFVTLGTRTHQFRRLAESAEDLVRDDFIKEKVIVQLGSTIYKSPLFESFDYCSPAEIDRFIASSKYIITQESAGIVTKCLKFGKRFIVMPREYRYGELPAKSDMNEDLHHKLAELGFTYVVHDKGELKEAIAKIDALRAGYVFDNRRAIEYLRTSIENK